MAKFPALVIGLTKYDDGVSLVGVKKDVSNVTKELRRIGYSVSAFGSLLLLGLPRARVVSAIKSFAKLASQAGGGVLYISGRGTLKTGLGLPLAGICPSDVVAKGPIWLHELQALLGEVAPQVVVMLDCGLKGPRSYAVGQTSKFEIPRLPALSAPHFFNGAAPETSSGGQFTSALVKALSTVAPLPATNTTDPSVGVSVQELVAAIQATLSAPPEEDGNPGVEINGSTNGLYEIATIPSGGAPGDFISASYPLVVLPPGPFLPGLHPVGFTTGREYWHQDFAWPDAFVIRRGQSIDGLTASNSQQYEWKSFPSTANASPPNLSGKWWHITLETTGDVPQEIGTGFLCKTNDSLLWFATNDALAPGGNVLHVGYSVVHGCDLQLRFEKPTQSVSTAGLRWVICDKLQS
jgi:hypothetical protein